MLWAQSRLQVGTCMGWTWSADLPPPTAPRLKISAWQPMLCTKSWCTPPASCYLQDAAPHLTEFKCNHHSKFVGLLSDL